MDRSVISGSQRHVSSGYEASTDAAITCARYGEIRDSWNWYRDIDIFVSNSYSEGLQVALMEASASGCYALSHRWDGAEEVLPQANLFLTEDGLRDKIVAYCEESELAKRQYLASTRQMACERFDLRNVCNQVRQILEDVGLEYR